MLQRSSDYDHQLPDNPIGSTVGGWQQPTVDLRELVRILRRRWRILAAVPAVLLALALALCHGRDDALYGDLNGSGRSAPGECRRTNTQQVLTNFGTDDATIESQTLLIQSVAILQRVVEKMKLTADPEFIPKPSSARSDRLSNQAAVRQQRPILRCKPGRCRDRKVHRDPAEAHEGDAARNNLPCRYQCQLGTVLRRQPKSPTPIADGYFEEQVRAKYDATKIAASWLNSQIDGLKSRVLASEQAVEKFRADNNLSVAAGRNGQRSADHRSEQQADRRARADGGSTGEIRSGQTVVEVRRRSRQYHGRDFLGHDHQASHAIRRYREERGRSLQQIRPASSSW